MRAFSERAVTLRRPFPHSDWGHCQLSEASTSELDPSPSAGPSPPRGRWLAIGAVAVASALWLVFRGGNSEPAAVVDKTAAGAVAVSPADLSALAATLGHPLYWLGRKPGITYELRRTGAGAVFVRYLPSGVAPGANRPYLTVATYPFPGSYRAIKKRAAAKGAVTATLASRGLAVLANGYPSSTRDTRRASTSPTRAFHTKSRYSTRLPPGPGRSCPRER